MRASPVNTHKRPCINSSQERKNRGKKPYKPTGPQKHPFVESRHDRLTFRFGLDRYDY